jgi:hypothetical protein
MTRLLKGVVDRPRGGADGLDRRRAARRASRAGDGSKMALRERLSLRYTPLFPEVPMTPAIRLAVLALALTLAACTGRGDRTAADSARTAAASPGGLDTAASRTDTTMIRLDTLHKDTTRRP